MGHAVGTRVAISPGPRIRPRSCCNAETFHYRQVQTSALAVQLVLGGSSPCELVGICLPFYAYRGRLSLTSQMETRDDRNLWRIVSRRITVGRGPSLHSARGASEQAVWARPICQTLCVGYWDIGCRTITKSALTLIPVPLSACCAQ